jgi:FkbM family methyltransferase
MRPLQTGLLALYRAAAATGVLNTSWGRTLFESTYWLYKSRYEAGPIQVLRRWVRPGTAVIDVGANVGFFTLQFASWVTNGGKVFALEPEAVNFARLQRAIARAERTAVVETIQAAVGETTGEALLEINPIHPGDHKLASSGVAVAVTTLDHLLGARGWPEVSFIKIDVQGAEGQVLAGAGETIQKFRPALFIEVDDPHLKRFGSSARALLTSCTARGYALHTLTGKDISSALTVDQALTFGEAKGYTDFLLLPAEPSSLGGAP